jgi:hypothetical protein
VLDDVTDRVNALLQADYETARQQAAVEVSAVQVGCMIVSMCWMTSRIASMPSCKQITQQQDSKRL